MRINDMATLFFEGQERYPEFSFRLPLQFVLDYLQLVKTSLTTVKHLSWPNKLNSGSKYRCHPSAEQHRIVAKVDELMAVCDQLDKARAEREVTRDRLMTASLARLNNPDPETFQDDARFALDALPAMTARTDQIKRLRQTILNLAVRGKLVPQDPKDEPVSELLKQMTKERTWLVQARSMRAPLLNEDDKPAIDLPLPTTWKQVTVAEVAYLSRWYCYRA